MESERETKLLSWERVNVKKREGGRGEGGER